jgi:hypothetical protein
MTISYKRCRGELPVSIDNYITELVDILKREIRSFNTVIELLILEEKNLVSCDTASIVEVVERQEDLFSSIACLEKSRKDILSKIAGILGYDPQTLTITRLSGMIGNPLRKELLETGLVLSSVYENTRRKKTSNSLLIRQGIMMVENDIRLILNAAGKSRHKSPVYSSGAGHERLSGSFYLDNKM